MSTHSHDMALPRIPLFAVALLIISTLLAVAAIRLSGMDIGTRSRAPVVSERSLHFEDRPDGSIVVFDAGLPQGKPVHVVAPGSNGFLRGTLRALVRERRRSGLGAEQPFHLVAHGDGRLTLHDPATGQRVDLESFGPTNAAVFAQLLDGARLQPAPR